MKKQIFITAVFILATSFICQLYAQETTMEGAKTAGYDLKKAVKCRISSTETGCDIVFNEASGQTTEKRQHKPYYFSVSASDNTITAITSPRDAASGQASGKRSVGGSTSNKVSVSDINVMIVSSKAAVKQEGGVTHVDDWQTARSIPVANGEFALPENCPDGKYDLTISWNWEPPASSGKRTYTAGHFILEVQGGTFMAINEKGPAGTKGTTKN